MAATTETAAAAAAPAGIKIREGWLVKQGAKWKTWKRRWFKLNDTNTRLYYYIAKRDVDDVCQSRPAYFFVASAC